uniref:adenylate cyclase type 8-like n=1 Tax=Myxine glutinosa TaxID=7769 RepID=UPI00358E9D4B
MERPIIENKTTAKDHCWSCCAGSLNCAKMLHGIYFVFTGIMAMVTCAVFLRFNSVLKLLLLLAILIIYSLLIMVSYAGLFIGTRAPKLNNGESELGHRETCVILMVMFVMAVFYHGRQLDYTARLDFLWRLQARQEVDEMRELREHNENLLRNILPNYVAQYFLEKDRENDELFSQSHEKVGVMFASIPEFADFYSQTEMNNQGIECLRLLNEIIADFDELLSEDRFQDIEKIKTIGSTYMAASGLSPDKKDAEDEWAHLCTLADFALAMRETLKEINLHSFNNFELRVGICHGPAVAGVIGARKPQYDIWGKTVNLASRMDSTGLSNSIQVPEETYQILRARGFAFEYRDEIYVKGISEQEGKLRTYFLLGRVRPTPLVTYPRRFVGQNSLAAVVFSLVQSRNKQKQKGAVLGEGGAGAATRSYSAHGVQNSQPSPNHHGAGTQHKPADPHPVSQQQQQQQQQQQRSLSEATISTQPSSVAHSCRRKNRNKTKNPGNVNLLTPTTITDYEVAFNVWLVVHSSSLTPKRMETGMCNTLAGPEDSSSLLSVPTTCNCLGVQCTEGLQPPPIY